MMKGLLTLFQKNLLRKHLLVDYLVVRRRQHHRLILTIPRFYRDGRIFLMANGFKSTTYLMTVMA